MYHLQNPLWKDHSWFKKNHSWLKQKVWRENGITLQMFCTKIKTCPHQMLPNLNKASLKFSTKIGFRSCLFWLSFWLIYYPWHPAALSEQSFITLLFSFGHDETFWLLAVLSAVMNAEYAPSSSQPLSPSSAANHPPSTLVFALILLLPAIWFALVGAWEDERWPGEKKPKQKAIN